MDKGVKNFTIQFPVDLYDWLRKVTVGNDVSMASYIRHLIVKEKERIEKIQAGERDGIE